MLPSTRRRAFTLIEMLVVMAIIAILVSLVLSINGLVQSKAARSRAEAEIKAMSTGCESYKADMGSYPQNSDSDSVDPKVDGVATGSKYSASSLFLYKALSGDANADSRTDSADASVNPNPNPNGTNYLKDFFRPDRLSATVTNGVIQVSAGSVKYIKDPWGNSYGYSTAGLKMEQDFQASVASNPAATRPTSAKGYNTTFDLWSTAGKATTPSPGSAGDVTAVWVKNW
jgi:prepilin-type N-terminal cleavage/methylation domain-containing protein